MDLKEIHIVNSIIEEVLSDAEIATLKHNLQSEENYTNFLAKLIEVLIEKDSTINLKDFLEFNNLSLKYLVFKNKINDLLEDLADLKFNGHSSENINFLIDSKNETFSNHLDFLQETSKAVKIDQRATLKKKLEQLDKLNEFDLSEQDIKTAVKLKERARLKTHLAEVNESGKKEAKVISLNFKTVLKFAAVLIFIIGPAIFFINRLNNTEKGTQELADNKKIIKSDTSVKKNQTPLDTLQLPNAESYSIENEILQAKNFGYASSINTKITISVFNISNQLKTIERQYQQSINGVSGRGYGPIEKKYQLALDSLNTVRETYTFNKKLNMLSIYTTKWLAEKRFVSKLKLLSIEKNTESILYLKVETNYYLIKLIGKNHDLKEEKDEDMLDRLMLVENQNDK
jgi:hypothetical protein